MSALKVGIVGLPNVGKSTLFNALLKKQQAYVANFPFATIEPNIGIVPVPDARLGILSKVIKTSESLSFFPPEVSATCEFLDIAGLIKGASKGEGLGNKFLSHIREVDAICHVVRAFSDPDIIKQGVSDPKTDFDVVETELKLADLETLDKQKDPGGTSIPDEIKKWNTVLKLKEALIKGISAKDVELSEEETKIVKQLSLLTSKPILVVLNVDEADLIKSDEIEAKFAAEFKLNKDQVIAICAKTESELADLGGDEQKEYLKGLGVESSGLEKLIKKAFATLGLITFLTGGEKEVRAWTIKKGINAQEASGVIHTDFIKKFIKADVCDFEKFVESPGWKNARDKGYVRSEGRDYIIKDGDVVEFKIGA